MHGWRRAQPRLCPRTRAPLCPSGGRGRGPTRRVGRVRWAAPQTGSPAPLTPPSPPGQRNGQRGERVKGASSERRFGSKSSKSRSLHFPRTALPFRGGGRSPSRSEGRVRWAAPRTGSPALLTLPSPPGQRGQRGKRIKGASSEPRYGGKSSRRRSLHFARTALRRPGGEGLLYWASTRITRMRERGDE